ncbi:MAG: STAS domain-containing protein [Nitrospira sp.]|nr:STAS domain-containing protein [Nitrospira sp.]
MGRFLSRIAGDLPISFPIQLVARERIGRKTEKRCLAGSPGASDVEENPRQLTPTGDLTIFEVEDLKKSLIKLFQNDGLVSLDLSQVGRIDTAAIQLLWAARKEGRMFVTGMSEDLRATLNRLGFSEPLGE